MKKPDQNENQGQTILIVDDNATNLEVITEYLESVGFEIMVARSGEDGIKKAQMGCPDLILLDVMMSGIDGFETCRRLKTNGVTQSIPVIFMTALNRIEDKVKGFAAGGVDYLTKPLQQEEVLARVQTHLQLQAQRRQLQQQAMELLEKHTELEDQHHSILQLNEQLQQEIRERRRAEAALEKANQELQRLAALDGLTRVANRRRFDEYLYQEWRRYTREQLPLSLILGDIDYFKHYNDTYGHQAGDECLRQIAQTMNQAVKRATDLVARYGGEEFAIILPNTESEGAMRIAHAVQEAIRMLKIEHSQSSVNTYVTLSLGVTCTVPNREHSPDILVAAADKALYEAKERGRNRIILKIFGKALDSS
jgi:diguanylate cyclase (GGDEF)-like protein